MNRIEALNILGLDSDASEADVKTAYKECVQILHPDRFAANKKLQDRATEQFKRLQDAYEYLNSKKGSRGQTSSESTSYSQTYKEAQLAGLAAARTQLISQRDLTYDERRNALIMITGGAVIAIFLRRIIWLAGLASTFIIWGIVSLIGALQRISTINEHLKEIEIQKRQLEQNWKEEE